MDNQVRPVDRNELEVLSYGDCFALLEEVPVGRVAFVSEGDPLILPVNFVLDGRSILFRTAPGAKLEAATRASSVGFEADDWDEETRSGWSVVITGRAEVVDADIEVERLEEIGVDYWADSVDRPFWVRIRPNVVSGRRLGANR